MKSNSPPVEEMLRVNGRQADFYDEVQTTADANHSRGYEQNRRANPLTRLWAELRHRQQASAAKAGVEELVKAANLKWVASHAHQSILEVGCLLGSQLTLDLMRTADFYQGVDLSKVAIAALQRKTETLGLAKTVLLKAGDFLIMESDRRFDVIYAHGVLHHFANPDVLFRKLADLTAPGGILVFVEPSACNGIYRTLRTLYRPLQSDAAWEWPFTARTVRVLNQYYCGVDGFGWGHYTLLLSVLCSVPILGGLFSRVYPKIVAREIAHGWHAGVWKNSTVTAAYRLRSDR